MTQYVRVFAIPALLVVVASLAACSSDESGPAPQADESPVAVSEGGGPPQYSQPVPLESGEYISPAGYPDARERGQQAERAEAGQPVFEGDINGIALRKMAPESFPDYCGDDDFERFEPTEIVKFGYLPPGTAVVTPQNASVCPDGTWAVVGEEFIGFNFLLEVYLRHGPPVALHEAPATRVSAVTINGFAGVVVRPLTADGYGASHVAWVTPGGMLEVTAFDLPLDEVIKIAEAVKCAGC